MDMSALNWGYDNYQLRNWKTEGFIPTSQLENRRFYPYFVIGKSKILPLLRNWKSYGFIPTA